MQDAQRFEEAYATTTNPTNNPGPVYSSNRTPVFFFAFADHKVIANNDAHAGRHNRAKNADISVQEVSKACDCKKDAEDATAHGNERPLRVFDGEHFAKEMCA